MKTLLARNPLAGWFSPAESTGTGQLLSKLGNPLQLACAAIVLLSGTLGLQASDPVGIYAFVDKVIFEPADAAPERVQVWGGFALATGRDNQYAKAQRGYMYFKLRPGEEEICRKEWADLKSVAGTGQFVAFGSRHDSKGTVRKPDAKPGNPDPYPKGWGLTKVKTHDYGPLNELSALLKKKAGTKAPPAPATGPTPSSPKRQ